jgi:SNF2 family DNA or RNA helicase
MKVALTKKKPGQKRLVLMTLDNREFREVRRVIYQEVLMGKYRPVRVRKGDNMIYKFHPRFLEKLIMTFPHAELSEAIENMLAKREKPDEEIEVPELDVPGFDGELWDFQKVGVQAIVDNKRFFLNDEMGLGKTLQALSAMAITDSFPALCVVPNNGKYAWARIMDRYFPYISYAIVGNNERDREEAVEDAIQGKVDILLCHYEALRLPGMEILAQKKWAYLVADEFHRIKNPQAKQTKAFHELKASRKLFMSGTPMLNGRVEELWSPLKAMYPSRLPTYYMFCKRHQLTERGKVVAYKNLSEVKNFLQNRSLRRRKSQVLADLPEKVYTVRYVDLTSEQRRLYNEIKDEMMLWLEDGTKKSINSILARSTRLKQACFSPELYGGSKHSTKLIELKEIVEELVANEEKAIIFSQWSKATRIIERELIEYNPAYVDGTVPAKKRPAQEDKFNNDPECKLYIGTIGANKEAITLSAATYVIFTDLDWVPGNNEQALSRSAAGGLRGLDANVDKVHIIELQARDTYEERIVKVLESKRKRNAMIVENDGGDKIKKITLKNIRDIL